MDEAMSEKLSKTFTEGVSKGFLQDVEIWKHKTRIDNPLLVEEDGAVYQMRRWYQQFYVDAADVTPDMTDRFEIEVDTTKANEFWNKEVEVNLQRQEEEKAAAMSDSREEQTAAMSDSREEQTAAMSDSREEQTAAMSDSREEQTAR
jgi:3-ketosteroid 9alpha-monooxygenase subunit A